MNMMADDVIGAESEHMSNEDEDMERTLIQGNPPSQGTFGNRGTGRKRRIAALSM